MAPELAVFWEQLLSYIEQGLVVPVIGRDLMALELDGRQVLLYEHLADRLAGKLGLPGEHLSGSLNEVACRYLQSGGDLEYVYSALKSILPGRDELPIPPPLLELAAIRPFKLFVTTTFDVLLARAINAVRFGGAEKTDVLAYFPSAEEDLRAPLSQLDRPVVFHLFGKLSAVPDYAVTDEDILEWVHSLLSKSGRPNLLFDELNQRHLLFVGCSFADWLARFFLRMARRERLSHAPGKTDVVADATVRRDPGLVLFLERFSAKTKIFPEGGAVEFVHELAAQWSKRHPEVEPNPGPIPPRPPPPPGMEPGAIFLSYAHEDLMVVEALKAALEAVGIDVWFDREALGPGDAFEAKIRRDIDSCSLFVPILSRHTLTAERRFFRVEWEHAERVAVTVAPATPFIVPVAIDDISPREAALPQRFRDVNWQRLPDGQSTPAFVAAMRQLFRDYHKSSGGGP